MKRGQQAPAQKAPGASVIVAALFALLSVWIAAGSTGMLAHSLRRGLTLVALVVVVLLAWPIGRRPLSSLAWLAASIPVAAVLLAAPLPPLNVLAVAMVLFAVSRGHESRSQSVIQRIAEAAVLLALYHIACTSIPWLWMIADGAGGILGSLAAAITRQPLRVGATFGGLDFLLVSSYLVIALMTRCKPAANYRWLCSLGFFLGVALLGHLLYLAALGFAPAILKAGCMQMPDVVQPPAGSTPPPPGWISQFRLMIPWNMPMLAAFLQLGVIAVVLVQIRRMPELPSPGLRTRRVSMRIALAVATLILAAVAVIPVALFPRTSDLHGKKIVFYEKGFLNWLKPEKGQYGRLMSGMYGLTPPFLESYGALTRSSRRTFRKRIWKGPTPSCCCSPTSHGTTVSSSGFGNSWKTAARCSSQGSTPSGRKKPMEISSTSPAAKNAIASTKP